VEELGEGEGTDSVLMREFVQNMLGGCLGAFGGYLVMGFAKDYDLGIIVGRIVLLGLFYMASDFSL